MEWNDIDRETVRSFSPTNILIGGQEDGMRSTIGIFNWDIRNGIITLLAVVFLKYI